LSSISLKAYVSGNRRCNSIALVSKGTERLADLQAETFIKVLGVIDYDVFSEYSFNHVDLRSRANAPVSSHTHLFYFKNLESKYLQLIKDDINTRVKDIISEL
jgi:hypothetical protein